MKFQISRESFLYGVQKTLGVVEKKTTMPILTHVLIRAQEDRIQIVATDREIGIVTNHAADVDQRGEITLSAKKLYEMLREIPGETVRVESKENHHVSMQSQKFVYKIMGLPPEDFPQITSDEDISFSAIAPHILREMIRKTFFAMTVDETRKNLNGVLFEAEPEGESFRIGMVATDGHRLSLAMEEIPNFLPMDKGVIIPRKGVMEIRKLIDTDPVELLFGIRQGMCVLKTPDTMLKVSLVEAEYPDYRRIIPKEKGSLILLKRDEFLQVLRRMSVISSERYSGVILDLKEGKMIVTSTNPDIGEASDEMDVPYRDKELRVGYNVHYLMEAVEVVDGESLEFDIGVGMKPSVVRQAGNDRYFCMIMPLKV